MTRLPRTRRGKTPIDVTIVTQEAGPRVRVTIGDDLARPSAKKNSDLDAKEVEDLIVMLEFNLRRLRGEV